MLYVLKTFGFLQETVFAKFIELYI
jgi:hypothetical protein